jgi:hypothetical protein
VFRINRTVFQSPQKAPQRALFQAWPERTLHEEGDW